MGSQAASIQPDIRELGQVSVLGSELGGGRESFLVAGAASAADSGQDTCPDGWGRERAA